MKFWFIGLTLTDMQPECVTDKDWYTAADVGCPPESNTILLLYRIITLHIQKKILFSFHLLLPSLLSGSKAQVVRESSTPAVWGRRTSPETWPKDHNTVTSQSKQTLNCTDTLNRTSTCVELHLLHFFLFFFKCYAFILNIFVYKIHYMNINIYIYIYIYIYK